VQLETDVALAPRTTLQLGGRARFFASVQSEDELAEALSWAQRRNARTWILGGGSNVVVPDAGLDGLVIAVALRGVVTQWSGETCSIAVKAGENWDDLVSFSVEAGLWGLECLSGIPGLVGATPIQNVGAYGQEVKDTLVQVRAFDQHERRFVEFEAAECELEYRDSRFKSREPGRFVVSEVGFQLTRTQRRRPLYPELERALTLLERSPTLAEIRAAVLDLRRSKSMLIDAADANARSCGSFFVNPVVPSELARTAAERLARPDMPQFPQADGRIKLSAAYLIQHSGLGRGFRRGNVGLSSKHTLALVCHDGATSRELLAFAAEVRATVRERSGIELTPEPSIW
jgi:UDP-N-acetylmuramate dehydrogenase